MVVRQWEFSETSQTALVLTREHGLLRLLAKGSRRPASPYSGGLDALTRGQIVAIVKPTSELATLTEWDLQEVFWAPRRSLAAHYTGVYMTDIASQLITDHDPHPRIFDALVDGLRALGETDACLRAALRVQWQSLVEAGYTPELRRDARSGAVLGASATYGFDPRAGGLVEDPGPRATGDVWRVRAETVDLLRAISAGGAKEGVDDALSMGRACRLLAAWIAAVIGAPPRSHEAFLGVIPATEPPKRG